jgi:hypothetical protein
MIIKHYPTKLHIPYIYGSLIITTEPKAKEGFLWTLFTLLRL